MPSARPDSSGVHGFEMEVSPAQYENVFAGKPSIGQYMRHPLVVRHSLTTEPETALHPLMAFWR